MYPTPEWDKDTKVCHYFTKEWVKSGYNVIVIHFQSIFPFFFYWGLSLFPKIAARLTGNDKNIPSKRIQNITFLLDGVKVYSIPIFKLFPHMRYSKNKIFSSINKIQDIVDQDIIRPDAIIGHFYNPQLEIISALKNSYNDAKTCIVLHESPLIIKKKYGKKSIDLLNSIDVWGFRYKELQLEFEKLYGKYHKTFICHSGIPEKYINSDGKKFNEGISKFCFAGQLIKLKRVNDILYSLALAFPQKDFYIKIVGEGIEFENLLDLSKKLGIEQNVLFTGNKPRDVLQGILNDIDCYVMVSETEAFGLVYLEAMGKGCITIGSKGQGIDGVIIDGHNGFLCNIRDTKNLVNIFRQIKELPADSLRQISKNAVNTSRKYTDKKAADRYIQIVTQEYKPHK